MYTYLYIYIYTLSNTQYMYKHISLQSWVRKDFVVRGGGNFGKILMIRSYPEREREGEWKRVSYVSLKWKYFDPTNILPFWGTRIPLHTKTTQSSKAENVENHNFIAQRNKLFWHWLWIATTLVRSTGTGYILCWCNGGGSGLNIDNVLNHIIFIHICVYTQEVIVQLWEIFKFLFHLSTRNWMFCTSAWNSAKDWRVSMLKIFPIVCVLTFENWCLVSGITS